jgi:hypothetical protein
MSAWMAPFRRFWLAYVDALERYLDGKDPSAVANGNIKRMIPAQIEKMKKETRNEN